MKDEPFTIGVEEEFFIVDAGTRALRPRAEQVLDVARLGLGEHVSLELNLAQIETATPVCSSLPELRQELARLRRTLVDATKEGGSRLLPAGTHPFSDWLGQQITPKQRYEQIDNAYQQLAWEQLVCGCHVHVCVPDPELAVAIMNRLRPWLATLRALTTNSPFWQGVDTGYASYRMEVFDRWPTTGIPPPFPDRAAYDELVSALVATATIEDASKIYWDIRPSMTYATLEFRVADALPTVEEVIMLTGLARSLTRVAACEEEDGHPVSFPHAELLRAARWRAARYGVSETLVDVIERRAVPAADLVDQLLAHLRDDLSDNGEWQQVSETARAIARGGTGATRQRRTFAHRGDLRDVVDDLVATMVP